MMHLQTLLTTMVIHNLPEREARRKASRQLAMEKYEKERKKNDAQGGEET
jgi:hypothetical protein